MSELFEPVAVNRAHRGFGHDSQQNISHDWYTPPWIFEALGLSFDLDPCAPAGGVPWIPAARHYSIADNGLNSAWAGRVWLNPPYGKETKAWLARMDGHRNGVSLVFARTDCAWYHDYAAKCDGILFVKGRIKFVDARGATGESGAGAGSMLLSWGSDNADALRRMAADGRGHFVSTGARA